MVSTEQALGNLAEVTIRLQCVPGYIVSPSLTLESKCAVLQSTLLKYLFPEKCSMKQFYICCSANVYTQPCLSPGTRSTGTCNDTLGQRLYFGNLRFELCRGAVHLTGPAGLEFLRKPWPCFCLDSLPSALPMSQSYFLRNVAKSLEPCQRFTVPAACTINQSSCPVCSP